MRVASMATGRPLETLVDLPPTLRALVSTAISGAHMKDPANPANLEYELPVWPPPEGKGLAGRRLRAAKQSRPEPTHAAFNPSKVTIASLTGRSLPPEVAAPKLSEAEEKRLKQKRMADVLQRRLSERR